MKIACRCIRSVLAQYAAADREIPPTGAVARHITVCAECSNELKWFRAAHRSLMETRTSEQASADFADSVWTRFSASGAPHRSLTPRFALSIAASVVAVMLMINLRHLRTPVHNDVSGHSSSMRVASRRAAGPAELFSAPMKINAMVDPDISKRVKKRSDEPGLVRYRRARLRHGKRMMARIVSKTNHTQLASASKAHSARKQLIPWDQVAAWYENQGDYRSAAAAYVHAAKEKPTDVRVFRAAQALEYAGDIAEAVEYYTRVLKHENDQESRPNKVLPIRKGTWQWNKNRNSA